MDITNQLLERSWVLTSEDRLQINPVFLDILEILRTFMGACVRLGKKINLFRLRLPLLITSSSDR